RIDRSSQQCDARAACGVNAITAYAGASNENGIRIAAAVGPRWARAGAGDVPGEGTMGDFSELLIYDGVGDIHLNRFRIAFEPPSGTTAAALGKAAATLAADLIDNFPTYLESEYATVRFGERDHEGKPTLHFHGYAKVLGIDQAAVHDD